MNNRIIHKLHIRYMEAIIILKYSICAVVAFFFPKNAWVITERGKDARDNGYCFYKYMKKTHPERKLYFIIDRNSADYAKVKEDAVQFGSMKSYILLAAAEKLISTHYAAGLPVFSSKMFRILGLHRKLYFLQHGIIKDNLHYLHGDVAPMKLFVCGAAPEYEYIKRVFRQPYEVVKYTGLARFDQLHEITTKKQIVVMPTWRGYITNEQEFLESAYYASWQSLLLNQQLISELESYDLDLIFYVHFEMQKYIDHFIPGSERIKIASFREYDVQALLKESKLMITDYSSVALDFAYMYKPVIYYQFDEDAFFDKHYSRGYFDYREMGFGEVCVSENKVMGVLEQIFRSDMQIAAKYRNRIKDFFPLYDKENCKRIYEAIAADSRS